MATTNKSSAIGAGAPATVDSFNNSNSNNENEELTQEQKDFPVAKQGILTPEYKPYGEVNKSLYNKANLTRFLSSKSKYLKLEDIQSFFTYFNKVLWNSDGQEWLETYKPTNVFERKTSFEDKGSKTICTFLGTVTTGTTDGCKLSSLPTKLLNFTKYMLQVILFFFQYKVEESAKKDLLKDEYTMKLFMSSLRNLFYFFGQNQVNPPFYFPEADEMFSSFIDNINKDFKTTVIDILCQNKKEYGCGRFLDFAKCDKSGKFTIYIYKTIGPQSQNVPTNFGEQLEKKTSQCGGKRKTIKRKKSKRYTRRR